MRERILDTEKKREKKSKHYERRERDVVSENMRKKSKTISEGEEKDRA